MKLILALDSGEVWASWNIKPGGPDPDGVEDLDGPIDETIYIEDLKKYRIEHMLDDIKSEILRAAEHRPE